MNNFEKIKSMDIHTMACWLVSYELYQLLTPDKKDKTGYKVFKNIKQWLESEVESAGQI